ncbi:MAG: tripartite tricarboxylate transporter substrate binding protein [Betaproteobacteria bacterium]|nr:tripartite tricarboxylate transporter substrate binding protein [Betaproteobacteria bacterium]
MKTTIVYAMLISAPLIVSNVGAQTYPTKPVRIFSPWAAGGPGDVVTRGAAQELAAALGQPYVVETRVGADGMIVAEAGSKTPPDGYNLTGCDQQIMAINPVVHASRPYEIRDLAPVVLYGFLASGLHVSPSMPVNTLPELLELARSKPGAIAWGSFGAASASNFYIEWLKNTRNIQFLNVPYKGASFAWQGLLAGDVQVAFFAVGPSAAMRKTGKIKTLAVMLGKRVPQMPDVPSYAESPGLDFPLVVTWFGLCAQAATPQAIVQRLNAEVSKRLVANEALREKFMTSQGLAVESPGGESSEAFGRFLTAEQEKYAKLAKLAGIKPQ